MSTIANISDARIKFPPTVKATADNKPYVQLTVSEYAGKNADGTPHYNEYHLFVWNKFDIELARSLGVGDRIVVSIERCKNCFRIDQNTGKVYPYTSGNVCTNSISAIFTNNPSEGLRNYEFMQQQRRDSLKQNNQVAGNEHVQPVQAAQPVQTTQPVQTQPVQPAQNYSAPPATNAHVPQTQAQPPMNQPNQPQATTWSNPPMEQANSSAQNFDSAPWPVYQPSKATSQTQPPAYQPNNPSANTQPNGNIPDGYEVEF